MKKIYMFSTKVLTLLCFASLASNAHAQYCNAGPSSTADSNIEFLTFVGNSNTINYTGCTGTQGSTGLLDLTSTHLADVERNTTYSIDVTYGFCGNFQYGGFGKIWIDFNSDGDYDDAGEEIGATTISNTAQPLTTTYTFTVPATATIGLTRMRAMQREGGNAGSTTPCGTYNWGSATDFSINIIDCSAGPTTSTISAQSCGYYSAPSGKQFHSAGTYLDTITNYLGCDSIITINLSTTNSFSTITPNACGPYTVPSGSYSVGAAGTYYDTLPNAVGCDSVITINLTSDNSYSTFSTIGCNVYTAPSGAQYTLSGVYLDTITNAAGCDSVMTISLDMFFDNSITIIATVCNPPYIGPSGTAYNTSGTYLDQTLSSINGCDSLVFVNTTVAQGNIQNITISACDEWTSPSGDTTTTSSGIITESFPGSTGCDSIINYSVSINTVNRIATFVSALTVEAAETGADYQWIDCNNGNAMIAGANSKTYVSPTNGDFACMVTKNGCTELTNCVRLGSLGIDDENINSINIYPNPSNGIFSVELTELSSATTVRITNTAGQLVYTSTLNDTKTEISLGNIEAGLYIVSIENANNSIRKTIIIE